MKAPDNVTDTRRVTRIGALAPLSAPGWVEAGRHLLAGLELAADTNTELVVRDTAGDPQRAAAAVDELADLGVDAIAGEYHSVVARAAAARAHARAIPFLCSSAVLDALTDEPTDHVARIAPPQSRGWSLYAGHLKREGHTHIAVAAQPSVYWAAGTRILRQYLTVTELAPGELPDAGITALLLLADQQRTAEIIEAVRREPRLADLQLGAPAGQPEFTGHAGVPFLRYLPDRLTPLGDHVQERLQRELGTTPSFVAFEGYDTILALRARRARWDDFATSGTRGMITFERVPGVSVWQWAAAPVQIAERDPRNPSTFRVIRSAQD